MKKLFLLTMIIFFGYIAEASSVKIHVTFRESGKPVPYAKIRVEKPNGYFVTGLQTNKYGRIIIQGLQPNTEYVISACFLNGDPGTVKIITPPVGITIDKPVLIEVPGDEIIVTPSSIFSYTTAHNLKTPRLVAILEKKKNKAYHIV